MGRKVEEEEEEEREEAGEHHQPPLIRRVDIIVAPARQYPYALVSWTGSKVTVWDGTVQWGPSIGSDGFSMPAPFL